MVVGSDRGVNCFREGAAGPAGADGRPRGVFLDLPIAMDKCDL